VAALQTPAPAVEEVLLQKVDDDVGFAADAVRALFKGRLPGQRPGRSLDAADQERLDELEHAGELMLVRFFANVHSALVTKPKPKG
jgi:hypothetical protein